MAKIKLTKVPFKGTAEQESKLKEALSAIKTLQGNAMPGLQAAQHIYGYLPIEVMKIIASELDIPLEEIFGIATFYSQFTLNPRGKYTFAVCMGTACYVKGAGDILDKLKRDLNCHDECTEDGMYSVLGTRCIGCCGLAPVITVNEDVYGKIGTHDVPGIIAKYEK
jgi:NADH:ubiquinone oxidoreductase subunit E